MQESQLKSVLENYFIKSEIPEELPSDLSTLELTTLNNKYKIKVSEIYDGTFITIAEEPSLAKDKLIINLSAENDYEISPYVSYPSAKGNILCRVLYDANSEYVLQIVAIDPISDVKLGIEDKYVTLDENVTYSNVDEAKAIYLWQNAVSHLNKYSEEYLDKSDSSGIASDARCVGSNPTDKTKDEETNNETDKEQLEAIGAYNITNENDNPINYWMASRLNTVQAPVGMMSVCVAYDPGVDEPQSETMMISVPSNVVANTILEL